MGDFNAVADASVDKSTKRRGGRLHKVFFFDLAKQEQLEDIWRQKNEGARNYTFYSASKKAWSRIDMIWASKSLLPMIKRVEILPKIMLDYSPVVGVFRSKNKSNRWRLNEKVFGEKRKFNIYSE